MLTRTNPMLCLLLLLTRAYIDDTSRLFIEGCDTVVVVAHTLGEMNIIKRDLPETRQTALIALLHPVRHEPHEPKTQAAIEITSLR